MKRKGTVEEGERVGKRPFLPQAYNFEVLMPHGITVPVRLRHSSDKMCLSDFTNVVKQAYDELLGPALEKPVINWCSPRLHFVDAFEVQISRELNLAMYPPGACHMLRLKDGSAEAETYQNMWDLTPHTDLLKELPEEYTFETALADLIDNSLQAVWSNEAGHRKLIKVKVVEQGIVIFDTGPGMDASPDNCIVKWGKLGASLHRSVRERGIGTKPPYLMPCFGMFGFGGPLATMHLGRRAAVASKTCISKKVYLLYLERETLLNSSSEHSWRANGGIRDPNDAELEESPHGSFTKVEIRDLRMKSMNLDQLRCRLKDIYFPYIQCDELSGTSQTRKPIEFEVNGMDLAEVISGEVAVTNMHSCNGPEFTLQLQFTNKASSSVSKISREANARLRCVYFPIIQGKESIASILEKLTKDGCGISEDFKSFSRVSIRRLGRLLPEARWAWLPFMEPKQKKGVMGQTLRTCCYRVKCFVDTDGGFNPTTSKTDLAPQNPFTIALKTFGKKQADKEKGIQVKITKDGKSLGLAALDKLYEKWLSDMHDRYDEEMATGCDEATFIISPSNKEDLGISSEVIRAHKRFQRNDALWKSGQKVKILKGACAGFHRADTYAILEYIILEGLPGDAGSEARLICRSIDVPAESGCLITQEDGATTIRLGSSFSLPISVIDSQKFIVVDNEMWKKQLEKRSLKAPSAIEILSAADCHELGFKGALPRCVNAGYEPPEDIVAVIRPWSYKFNPSNKNLDGKHIVQEQILMLMEIRFRAEDSSTEYEVVFSVQIVPSSRRSINGFYIFKLRKECPKIFEKAGFYTFLFSLKEYKNVNCEKRLQVKALQRFASWRLLDKKQMTNLAVRVGSCFPPLSIACFDKYGNRLQFPSDTKLRLGVNFISCKNFPQQSGNNKVVMSTDRLVLTLKDVKLTSAELDMARPDYNAIMRLSPLDELCSVTVPFQLLPGAPGCVLLDPECFDKELVPGEIIENMVLEVLDIFDNHIKENDLITLQLDGLCVQDGRSSTFKANANGFVDLSGVLKVVKGYGQKGSFSVISDGQSIFEGAFQTEGRELRAAFQVPITVTAGSRLENLAFEVVGKEGEVDGGFHSQVENGGCHSLTISSDSFELDSLMQYSFTYGRCIIREIPYPRKEGKFSFKVTHSHHPELNLNVEVHIMESHQHFEDEGLSAVPNSAEGNSETRAQNGSKVIQQLAKKSVPPPTLKVKQMSVVEAMKKGRPGPPPGFEEQRIIVHPESSTSSHPGNQTDIVVADHMIGNESESWDHLSISELEVEILKAGTLIREIETKIKSLTIEQSVYEKTIASLQAEYVDHAERSALSFASERKLVTQQIALKTNSAAAVMCRFSESSDEIHSEFAKNILGTVACIGSLRTDALSRILAHYLGEQQMLGIVCKSREEDFLLENDESVSALAHKLGMPLPKDYHIYCVENMSPYTGPISTDFRRKLLLPSPSLPTGECPPGFLGYAVNLIELDAKLRLFRTASGHGLRETLLHRLFGKLQVYETRDHMRQARACITGDGAVSLDGAILRGNGALSLGHRDVEIRFPIWPEVGSSPGELGCARRLEVRMDALREVKDGLVAERVKREEVLKRFRKQERRLVYLSSNLESSPMPLPLIKRERGLNFRSG